MSQIDIRNAEGEVARTIELADSVFGIEPNIPVIHQVVVCQAASMRQGTHSVKNRHDVSGGGKKPYRQKGSVTPSCSSLTSSPSTSLPPSRPLPCSRRSRSRASA